MPSKKPKRNTKSAHGSSGETQPGEGSNSKKPTSKNSKLNRRSILKTAVAGVAASVTSKLVAQEQQPKRLFQIGGRTKPDRNLTPLKQRAMDDYRRSFAHFGGQLSSPIRELFLTAKDENRIHFGVVVIGSGYGASITAAKLSQKLRPGLRMCIVERGKEWIPGTFQDQMPKVFAQNRSVMSGPTKGQVIQPLGLFNIQFNDEVNILAGNGLGGGSLINASIALRPHREVFQKERWPMALKNIETLGPYYDQVARALSLSRTPMDQTPKVRSRRLAAARLSNNPNFFDPSHLSVMYDHRYLDDQMRNPQGVIQRPCTLCGDCGTGCNIGAKNTLQYNYLPVARHNGTEMFTQCEVTSIEKRQGYYRVHMTYIDDQYENITRHPVSINTQMVVVGAGSPASASILLDSQTANFQFSPKLGFDWSGNGDLVGFVVDLPPGNNIGGFGAHPSPDGRPVGPTVQTSLNFYRDIELRRRLLIQEASIPKGVKPLFKVLMGDRNLDNTMVMLGMGHDGANGKVIKKDGRWQVKWEGHRESEYRKMVFQEFERLAAAHGGRYKRLKAFGPNLVTVHPLGGCGMSDDPRMGPTNHLGQVYDLQGGGHIDPHTGMASVHHGLYVADGSVIPTALGVNPYMTISAISQRIAEHIVHNPAHANLFA